MMYYNNIAYANERLRGTFVNSKKGIVQVHIIRADEKVDVINWTNGNMDQINLSDIDLTPFKLGYLNYLNKAYYMTRRPARQWKQGLDINNIVWLGPSGRIGVMPYEQFNDAVNGKYISLKEIEENLNKNLKGSWAFARQWAISSDQNLFHKGSHVGEIDKNIRKISLYKNTMYLSEKLEEVLKVV